ncbi:N-6 DNA methylase [Streptomyces deccanensis]|uniref:N-6 DNA methylase n=1 Tax=Streptomyces deccanensis TaxID=424188 RepID=UPI001EFB984B|nr:N-6 DNA methylase [Streptomyces deccanensis]ULR51629.1 SAM-dependent methyltransferase [Streptomyces deccanensis]
MTTGSGAHSRGTAAMSGALLSRPEIARLAGVKRPAVTNWERRYPEYPAPVGGDPELFRADEVLAWLASRTIPANALLPDEPVGTTYGDRFRAGLTGGTAGSLLRAVERLAGPDADRMRGPMPLDQYLHFLLYLVMVRVVEEAEGLAKVVDAFATADDAYDFPAKDFPRPLLTELSDTLERTPSGSEQEAREAFDHVLTLWRAAYAREGGAFLTPPSVSRVMAEALAALRPGAVYVEDPYARAGELLVAYLHAVAAHGGAEPPRVAGQVPGNMERQVAEWSLRVHHGLRAQLGEGPVTPALDPLGLRGEFDVLLTNPPFGRLPEDVTPPPYWTYGPARRTEYDWLQYAVARLAPDGRAAVLMPAGASFNTGAAETVRGGLVAAGAVECVIALPAGLFTLTAVKTQIWFLRAPGSGGTPDPNVLFVVGEHLGHQVTRTQWALSDDDIARLVGEYVSWHRTDAAGNAFEGTPGLSRAVPVADIVEQGHSLDPVRYVRPPEPGSAVHAAGPDEIRGRLAGLTDEIAALRARADAAEAEAARWLGRYGL